MYELIKSFRTTLIINCAPSAYNGPETLSTLRFGVRAKTIKNSVHVNAELPPGELKLLLAKVRLDLETFQTHARGLEKEVCVWRYGSRVPEDQWIPLKYMNSLSSVKGPKATILSKSNLSLEMSQNERDSFLQRENEFSDQLAEKESMLLERDNTITNLQSIIDLNAERIAPAFSVSILNIFFCYCTNDSFETGKCGSQRAHLRPRTDLGKSPIPA